MLCSELRVVGDFLWNKPVQHAAIKILAIQTSSVCLAAINWR